MFSDADYTYILSESKEIILKKPFQKMKILDNDFILVESTTERHNFGLITLDDEIILEEKYKEIEVFNDYVLAREDEFTSIYKLKRQNNKFSLEVLHENIRGTTSFYGYYPFMISESNNESTKYSWVNKKMNPIWTFHVERWVFSKFTSV